MIIIINKKFRHSSRFNKLFNEKIKFFNSKLLFDSLNKTFGIKSLFTKYQLGNLFFTINK
jgi:hypothetical protein